MYFVVTVIFIPLGVAVYVKSTRMVSTPRIRYDNVDRCRIGPGPFANLEEAKAMAGNCSFSVEIERNITAPSYFYYGMVNFYQNARTYVSSRAPNQLRGDNVMKSDVKDCKPLINDGDGELLNPCGLVANSQFNDTFLLCRDEVCTDELELNGTNIAWRIDRERRFKAPDLRDDEDLMVWMRASAYRNWKKLYRRIEEDIPAGTYYVNATSKFPVEGFDGEKFFFISETTWFGGPNEILGISYIVVGSVTLVLALVFLVRSRVTQDLDLPPETTVLLDGISPGVEQTSNLSGERSEIVSA